MNDIRCPLREAAEISGNQVALVREGLQLTYRDYDLLVSAAAARLRKLGCEPGDRVGMFMQHDWTYPVLLMGLLRMGAVVCPLDVRLPRKQLEAALDQVQCRTLIAHTRTEKEAAAVGKFKVLNPPYIIGHDADSGSPQLGPRMVLDQPATIVFTSGSTGSSKAVLHSYGNHYYSARGSNMNIPVHAGNRWLLSLPLWHVSGLSILFRCILGGIAVALPRVNEDLASAIEAYEVTHLSLVPAQLHRLLQSNPDKEVLKRLRAVLVGGGPVSPELIKAARRQGLPVHTTYGLTEMASQVTATRSDTPPEYHHTAGTVLKFRCIRAVESGELQVCGRTLFLGYVDGESVDQPLTSDGWFATGDTGVLDEAGYLSVTGREDTMFVSGGENIHPEEIEQALLELPDVEEVVVVDVPDEEFGARPVAFLRMTGGKKPDLLELREQLADRLPRFKHPAHCYAWPDELFANGLKANRAALASHARALQQA